MSTKPGELQTQGDADVVDATQRSVVEVPAEGFDLFQDVYVGEVGGQFGNESRIQLGAVRVIGQLLLQVGEDLLGRVVEEHVGAIHSSSEAR